MFEYTKIVLKLTSNLKDFNTRGNKPTCSSLEPRGKTTRVNPENLSFLYILTTIEGYLLKLRSKTKLQQ